MQQTGEDTRLNEVARADELLSTIDELPSIPETLFEILKIIDAPKSSAKSLARVVRQDAPLMAKILRLANSPYFAGTGNLADIKSCINVLGFRTVRQVAICVSIASGLVAKCRKCRARLDYRELWRHSVVVGVIAKALGKLQGEKEPEELFTAGLLHDLGKFVLVLKSPATYDQVIAARRGSSRPLVEVETEMLGFDHTLAGEIFCRAWRFPPLLTGSTRQHHEAPGQVRPVSREDRAVALVRLADMLAYRLEPPNSDLGYVSSLLDKREIRRHAGVSRSMIEANEEALRAEISDASVYFDLA